MKTFTTVAIFVLLLFVFMFTPVLWRLGNAYGFQISIIIVPPTRSVGGHTSNGRWRLSSSVVCRGL